MLLHYETRAPQAVSPRCAVSPVRVFAVFFLAYLATWAGHLDSGDSTQKIEWARAILFHTSAPICKYSIGQTLLTIPFLAASAAVTRFTHLHAEGPIYMSLFLLNAAAFMALAAKYLSLRFSRDNVRRALVILGFCTLWWPYSKIDSSEQLVLTWLFAGFLLVRTGRPRVGMLIASFAIVIRPDAIVSVGLLALWHLWQRRDIAIAAQLGALCIPALLVNAAANFARWGTLTEAGYNGEHFSMPAVLGLYGILFSAGKSIFLYSPPLILGVAAFWRYATTGARGTRDYWFFASVLASQILIYCRWWDWSGDDAWGVRFLTPGIMLMTLPAAEYLGMRRLRIPVAALAAAACGIQLLAILIDPVQSDYLLRHFDARRGALFTGGQSRIDIEDLRFNPRYSPIAVNFLAVRAVTHTLPSKESDPLEISRTGTPLYNALLDAGWRPDDVHCDILWANLGRRK